MPTPSMHREELVPVPRSVFDDDFFRASARAPEAPAPVTTQTPDTRMPSARGFETPDQPRPLRVQFQETHVYETEPAVPEPTVRVPAFTGALPAEHTESDELDIPAFLRRSH